MDYLFASAPVVCDSMRGPLGTGRRYSGRQFDPRVVQVFLSQPDRVWLDLHERIGDPFRLTLEHA